MSATLPLILVIEDDPEASDMVRTLLETQGFRVEVLEDASKALPWIQREHPSLVLMDWYLPKLSGLDFVKILRGDSQAQTLPVILMSARATMVQDAVIALEAGADDYLIKPFDPRMLLARVQALIRRKLWSGKEKTSEMALRVGNITISPYERTVAADGKSVSLTRLEFELLTCLMKNKNRTFNRRELLEAIWKYPDDAETRTVDKHIETLRKKLGSAAKHIQTVPTVGYRFIED